MRVRAEEVWPGRVLVKVREGADLDRIAGARGLQVAERRQGFAILQGAALGNERAAARLLVGDAEVEWAEPDYLRQVDAIRPELWAFYNPGGLNMKYTSGKSSGQFLPGTYASVQDADEDNVEGYAAGGSDVVIGSIDTGVFFGHSEFTGRLIAGKDWYNNDNDPRDDDNHGSHTTGTMAGSTVGVAGVSGAAPHVKVYVQKVCGRRGCPTSAIVSAIRAAADYPGMVAMNLSLGGSSESQAEIDAIAYATSKNVLVIASAGNSGTGTVSCPACDPNAISVASTTWQDKLASYSQYGPGLDISAPGGNCYSNTSSEGCIYSANMSGGYMWMQGTSMAAPQVTGTAAVVASVTGKRGAALRSQLLSTADNLGDANKFGAGRVNTYRAVTGNTLAKPN
jgi:subtilisin family serine protease